MKKRDTKEVRVFAAPPLVHPHLLSAAPFPAALSAVHPLPPTHQVCFGEQARLHGRRLDGGRGGQRESVGGRAWVGRAARGRKEARAHVFWSVR